MLDVKGLADWMAEHFGGHGAEAFRLEGRQVYEVAADGTDYRRWLDGAPEPTWERKRAWFEALDRERAERRQRVHVRIVTRPITEYTAMECTWGYALNAPHGQRVRVLDLGERSMPDVGPATGLDWWLVTGGAGRVSALEMHYSGSGEFLGAVELEAAEVALRKRARDVLWDAAEDFAPWYARHVELHRSVSG